MTPSDFHRQAMMTSDDLFNHAFGLLCEEFNVKRGTSDARKLAGELAPVLAAMIQAGTTDLRTMLEHSRGEAEMDFRRNQSDDLGI